ncbi:MAG: ABC transporter ATP-binding protein/permease [Promicromonosporaceae bacterium]|nr:ABC transporter ATP-binding protein/permease [Promicromonosporaceae bacterium]
MLLKLCRQHLRPYLGAVAALIALQLLQTIASLFLPTLNADIIDHGVILGDIDHIWRRGSVMLAVSLAQVICAVIAVYFGTRVAMSFGRDLRLALFDAVQGFSAREVSHFGAPTLITRTTNDVQQVQMLVLMACTIMVSAPLMLIVGVFMALREDVPLSGLLLVVIPVLSVTLALVLRCLAPHFRVMQDRIDAINEMVRAQIIGLRVVRAFVRERREMERFGKANEQLYDTQVVTGKIIAFAFPLVGLIINVSSAAVIWFGGRRIDGGGMQIGALTAFLTYLMFILTSIMISTLVATMIPRAIVAARRIDEVLTTGTSVTEPAQPVSITSLNGGAGPRGEITFENVGFHYPGADEPVLSGLNFTARPGTVTAIIGATGAGKSTLLSLMPRLFDPTAGRVLFDGVDLRYLATAELGTQLGLVPQQAFLFSGTIASNLRYGLREATEEQMWAALRIAQGADFIAELPERLQAPVAQGGTTLSGGQRQRLAIARAIIRRPRVLLFDDSFSALDAVTDARLRAALRAVDATIIMVAQRVATIQEADEILVLEHGRIVGQGTHSELLATNATYQEIVASQEAQS